ncbi:MAG: hypothetical protein GWN71_26405, partial [Gammaproteobacteria bacterium]|nr:hypothetical protein [Gemmatimonadota bacterium]NIU76959.1 hypothetical protein [Gammaproteobacteria bacterium]
IAAATRNPAGLVYRSWKDGRGAMIWFWKNPDTGRYGLKELPLDDGTSAYWAPLDEAERPAHIGERGTVVVLLGRDPSDDTTLPPDGARDDGAHALWLTRYLNTRFFEFPEGVEVRARERWGTPASRVRPVRGMSH